MTTRDAAESDMDFVLRHYNEVATQQLQYPPDDGALATVEGY